MLKYLNYASYLILGLYSIYLFVVYISLKFNYLDKIRSNIINRFVLKYEISNNKELLNLLKIHYLITFLMVAAFTISLFFSSRISYFIVSITAIESYVFRRSIKKQRK